MGDEVEGDETSRIMQQIAQRLEDVGEGILLLHPTRFSMMLWMMDHKSRQIVKDKEDMDDEWVPRMVLGHEFSMLPCLYPHGYPRHRDMHLLSPEEDDERDIGLLMTPGCTSIQSMQDKLFKLGFGPLPYYRRPGVLLHISRAHMHHEDRSKFELGVIVSHREGLHGCR